MWFLLFFIPSLAFSQEPDLSGIRNLEEKLPDYNRMSTIKAEEIPRAKGDNKYSPSTSIRGWEKIKDSGSTMGSLEKGSHFVRLEDNVALKNHRPLFIRHYKLEDEQGYKYVLNPDGSTTYKIESRFVEPMEGELVLYEPPHKYTPAPANKLEHSYDKELTMAPEAALYVAYVNGDFMRDLFNDRKARPGRSTQYGFHYFTNWNLPLKVGAALHYEATTYDQSDYGRIEYTAFSFGPQIKTRDLEISNFLYRIQLQIRLSPFAKAKAITDNDTINMKFNTTDLMASLEHPMKNQWGEWVLGTFYQAQWLNFRDQPEIVSIRASNKINHFFGLSIAQVFE